MDQLTNIRESEAAAEVVHLGKQDPVHETVEQAAEWCRTSLTRAVEDIIEFGRRLNVMKARYPGQ